MSVKKRNFWTAEEIELLKLNYPSQGRNITELLSAHTAEAITTKATKLGVRRENFSEWSEDELNILRHGYPDRGTIIPELLKNRTRGAISAKAHKLSLKNCAKPQATTIPKNASKITRKSLSKCCQWTPEKLALLEKFYPTLGVNIPQLLREHTKASIASKAVKLGFKRNNQKNWTYKEINLLKRRYPTDGVHIPKLLATHSATAIRTRASELGIKKLKQTKQKNKI